MAPRLNLFGASRFLATRARPSTTYNQPRIPAFVSLRGYAEEKTPTGANQGSGLGHVSEEAADIGNVTGETKPDIGQGTPVQEILERDGDKEKAPEVVQREIDGTKTDANADSTSFKNLLALGQIEEIATGEQGTDAAQVGHKFGVPDLPIPSTSNLHHRYDPVVDQVTNLMMKDGKLSVAQRNMSFILNQLRTAPPPTPNPSRPLLPGSPPPAHLPLNPVGYLTLAIDSVAPLLRIRSQKGAAGGGAALQIPVPLGLRQRRRTAIMWILESATKKKPRGSGRGLFAQRVADELISVVEGKSSVWEKRTLVHRNGTSARVNLNFGLGQGGRKKF